MNTYTFDSYAVSDLYKDTHGVRPSLWFWDTWNAANDGEKQAIWDNLIAQFEVESDYERQEQLARIEEFELRIKELMAIGARDRKMAIRWILESLQKQDVYYDFGYGCYCLGLPYSYAQELKEAHGE